MNFLLVPSSHSVADITLLSLRMDFYAVSKLILTARQLLDCDLPFGGLVVVLAGDFRACPMPQTQMPQTQNDHPSWTRKCV